MPIQQLLRKRQHFGPEDINVLSSVLEEAPRNLRLVDRTDAATQLVAKRIIQLAQQGERDPTRADMAATSSKKFETEWLLELNRELIGRFRSPGEAKARAEVDVKTACKMAAGSAAPGWSRALD